MPLELNKNTEREYLQKLFWERSANLENLTEGRVETAFEKTLSESGSYVFGGNEQTFAAKENFKQVFKKFVRRTIDVGSGRLEGNYLLRIREYPLDEIEDFRNRNPDLYLEPEDDNFDYEFYTYIEEILMQPLAELFCDVYGHTVIPDHCGKPEHDFCMICEECFEGEAYMRDCSKFGHLLQSQDLSAGAFDKFVAGFLECRRCSELFPEDA